MRRVFLSSTARDLQSYRDAVFAILQKMGDCHCVRMEDFVPDGTTSADFIRQRVKESDVFIGILGQYHGSSPEGSDKSFTEIEYDAAVELDKPRLMFLTPDNFPLTANLRESDAKYKRQQEFRARVNRELLRAEFTSPEDLAAKVVATLHSYEQRLHEARMNELREKYLAHVIGEWRKIRLIGFSHGGKDINEPYIEEIFVPLQVEQIGETPQYSDPSTPFAPRTEREKVNLNRALAGVRRMVILGAPGAGKSTLLQYIALMFAKGQAKERLGLGESYLPLRVILREFARERSKREAGYAVEDYLQDYYHARGQEFPCEFFRHFIEQGECILLFDGMDEVGTAAQRVEMRDLIESLARMHPGNRVVVSSRPKGYEGAPLDRREFETFSLLDFDDAEIKQFITNWYRTVEGRDEPEAKAGAEKLSGDIERNPNVKRLAVNPLLLTIIATIHRTERLPNQRVRLYDKCAESLLVKWDEVRGVSLPPLGEEEQRRRLEHIAYWMHSEHLGEVSRDELQFKLARFLKTRGIMNADDEASRFIDRLVERTGILVERSPDRFAFVHRTFQEYFTAMDIYYRFMDEVNLQVVEETVMGHLHDPRWEEVSLLTIAKLPVKPTTRIVEKILNANSWGEDILHRDLFFAARVLADDVVVEQSVVNRIAQDLADGLLRTHGDRGVHTDYNTICELLATSEPGAVFTGRLRAAYQKFPDTRCTNWIQVLSRKRELQTAQLFLQLARTASDADVRVSAAQALGDGGRSRSW